MGEIFRLYRSDYLRYKNGKRLKWFETQNTKIGGGGEDWERSAMPVKWVLHWKVRNMEVKLSEEILNELTWCIKRLYGIEEGTWRSTLSFYLPILQDLSRRTKCAHECNGLSLYEEPNKYYFVIFPPRLVVEVDSDYPLIMEKLGSYRKGVSLHFEGMRYRCGDFQLRLGKISVPSEACRIRGIMMEIEYLPISSIATARLTMESFLDILKKLVSEKSVPGNLTYLDPKYSEFGLLDQYSSRHTAVQYAFLMANLII